MNEAASLRTTELAEFKQEYGLFSMTSDHCGGLTR